MGTRLEGDLNKYTSQLVVASILYRRLFTENLVKFSVCICNTRSGPVRERVQIKEDVCGKICD